MLDISIAFYGETGGFWIGFYLFIEVRCCAVPDLLYKLQFSLILYSFIDLLSLYILWLVQNQVSLKLHDLFNTPFLSLTLHSYPCITPVASSRGQAPSPSPEPSTHSHTQYAPLAVPHLVNIDYIWVGCGVCTGRVTPNGAAQASVKGTPASV
jgi:hypothetical protein